MKLFLIGMMGSGKSYWSKRIAEQLQLNYFDLDSIIEQNCKLKINAIFEQYGEHYFRQAETNALKNFANQNNFIVATGGGTPCFNNNMQWMNEHGTTIWIDEPIDILLSRLKKEKDHRPLIKQLDDVELKKFLLQKLNERTSFYIQAKFCLNSNKLSTQPIVELLGEKLKD